MLPSVTVRILIPDGLRGDSIKKFYFNGIPHQCLIFTIPTQSNRKLLGARQCGALPNYRLLYKNLNLWIITDLLAWCRPFAVLAFCKLLNLLSLAKQIFLTSSLKMLNNENLESVI